MAERCVKYMLQMSRKWLKGQGSTCYGCHSGFHKPISYTYGLKCHTTERLLAVLFAICRQHRSKVDSPLCSSSGRHQSCQQHGGRWEGVKLHATQALHFLSMVGSSDSPECLSVPS